MKKIKALFTLTCICAAATLCAQQGSVANGSEISGSGGTISQSVGQVVYTTIASTTHALTQGIQQTYEITDVGLVNDRITLVAMLFPNPAAESVVLTVEDPAATDFVIRDVQGKVLHRESVRGVTTTIDLQSYANGTYFVCVLGSKSELKTFRLIKTQ